MLAMVVSGIGLKRGTTEDTVDTEDCKLERRNVDLRELPTIPAGAREGSGL
jgi:hypothetical protein